MKGYIVGVSFFASHPQNMQIEHKLDWGGVTFDSGLLLSSAENTVSCKIIVKLYQWKLRLR